MDVYSKYENQIFELETDCKTEIPEKLQKYFTWNSSTKRIEKNITEMENQASYQGYFVIISKKEELDKVEILEYYRNKDIIEKMFDVLKNEENNYRLRVHSNETLHGRMFVKFISLILYMKITDVMKSEKLFDKMTIAELLLELKKIKKIYLNDEISMTTEISKKQKEILNSFKIQLQ